MKKYLFYIVLILFPVFIQAQGFLIDVVEPNSGTPGIPIDTIIPGEDFGLRIAGGPDGQIFLFPIKLDTLGNWVYEPLDSIFPATATVSGGIYSIDSAFFRILPIKYVKSTWMRIAVSTTAPSSALDTSSTSNPVYIPGPPSDSNIIETTNNPMGFSGNTSILIYPLKNTAYDVKIIDAFGYVVRNLIDNQTSDATGRYISAIWDGTNNKGTKVVNGIYQICVKEKGTETKIWKKKIGVVW